jgi:hypothetical protein
VGAGLLRKKEHERRRDRSRNHDRRHEQAGSGRPLPGFSPRGDAVLEYAVDPAKQEQLTLAVRARTHVREHAAVVAVVEQIGQPPPRVLVLHGASSPSRLASRFRPRRFQLFTEPSGTESRLAIALSLRSP